MDLKIIWSAPAIESLGEIVRPIAQDNPDAARRVGQQLVARVEITTRFPEIGPIYAHARPLEILSLVDSKYLIYYRVQHVTHTIEILAVRHGARQPPGF